MKLHIYRELEIPDVARDARRKLKEERQRKKERKRFKKAKMEKECLTERMNCFRLKKDALLHFMTEIINSDFQQPRQFTLANATTLERSAILFLHECQQ